MSELDSKNFKVGYRVVNNSKGDKPLKGTVLSIFYDTVNILFDGWDSYLSYKLPTNYLKLDKIKYNKLSIKIYPHYIKDGDYLICTKKTNQ